MEPVPWETADPDRDEVIPRSQTRNTRAANSRKRRGWYGMGSLAVVEKSWFGRTLDDLVSVYADVTVCSLPVLVYVWVTQPFVNQPLAAPTLAAWFGMVGVATLLRGGWIRPLGSETLGWVSTRYSLLVLRVLYYNAALLVGIYGGLAVESLLGGPGVAVVCAGSVGSAAALVFPTAADACYHRLFAD